MQGIKTTVLEWPVSLSEVDQAYVVVPGQVGTTFSGFLRVFAAPEYGFALPRIDYVSTDGTLLRRYESNDFIEVHSGLFYPRASRCLSFNGPRTDTTTFSMSEIQYVNQDLPTGEFDIDVPADTRVRDSRPGKPQAAFRLDEQSDVEDVHEIVSHDKEPHNAISFRLFCLGLNGLLATLFAFLWARNRCS